MSTHALYCFQIETDKKKEEQRHCLKHQLVYTTISLPKMYFSALIFQLRVAYYQNFWNKNSLNLP